MKILAFVEFSLVVSAAFFSSKDPKFFVLYIPAILMEIVRDLKCDEMFRYYRNRSSVEALYTIMILISVSGLVGIEDARGAFNTFLVSLLFLKNVLAVFHTMDRNVSLKTVGFSISAVLVLFTILSHGFSISTLVEFVFPLAVFLITLVSIRHRISGSILFFTYATILAALVLKRAKGIGGVAVITLLVIPLYALGYRSLRRG